MLWKVKENQYVCTWWISCHKGKLICQFQRILWAYTLNSPVVETLSFESWYASTIKVKAPFKNQIDSLLVWKETSTTIYSSQLGDEINEMKICHWTYWPQKFKRKSNRIDKNVVLAILCRRRHFRKCHIEWIFCNGGCNSIAKSTRCFIIDFSLIIFKTNSKSCSTFALTKSIFLRRFLIAASI